MTSRRWLCVVLLVCAVWVPYGLSLGNERIGDDRDLIVNRLGPEQVVSAGQLWEENYWGSYADSGLYRPIPLTLLYAQRELFGLEEWPYRVVNLLLYSLCGLLCFLFVSEIAGRTAGLGAALLFVLHPAHVEVVITAYGQAEILAAIFVLGALIAHVRGQWWLAMAAFLCGLLSKEVAVAFPLLAVATRGFWMAADGRGWRRWFAVKDLGYAGVLVVYAVWKFLAIGMLSVPASGSPMAALSMAKRLFPALGIGLGNYVRLSVFPVSQSMVYDVFPDARWDAFWVVIGALLAVIFAKKVGVSRVLFALVWFVATWLIFSNLFVTTGVFVAERCLFLPVLGLCCVFGFYWEKTMQSGNRGLAAGLWLMLALAGLQSASTAWDWRTEEDSLRASIENRPSSPMARANLALALLITPQLENRPVYPDESKEAEVLLTSTLRDFPNLPETHRGLGLLAMTRGDYRAAVVNLRRGLELRPQDVIIQGDLAHCERALQVQ